ncbi:GNAT family N-acetyltransferase [Ruminococcus sp.]|uniref:GNAT family N-acetyltransferase n=1 Tax=Ruminococcus sp. TaxID=41978 RepID=UPI0025E52E3F|nr:GNAT family N-acetyltransferase [Ruminococcus sp.]
MIRFADLSFLDEITDIESRCFPPEQAAKREQFAGRLRVYPQHFLLLCDDDGKAAAFVNGFVTDEPDLTDEMYAFPEKHNENGAWQMIFGLCTRPEHRHKGYAKSLMNEMLRLAKVQGRKGAVLTCKERLIGFYEQFGFVNEGISRGSVIGGVKWYQMRLRF